MATKITDHTTQAVGNLLSQYGDSSKLKDLVEIFAGGIQDLEDLFWELIDEQVLDVAVGVQLDRYGRVVGCPRLDLETDSDYRKAIKATIAANRSHGEGHWLAHILYLLLSVAVRYLWQGQASYCLEYEVNPNTSAALRARLLDLVERATPVGVAYRVVEGLSTDAFRFDAGPGFDQGKLGDVFGENP